MNNTLVILLLAIAILAIFALPRLGRGKQDSAKPDSPRKKVTADSPQADKTPDLATAAQIDAQPLTRWLCDQACMQTGVDLRQDRLALTRIAKAAAIASDEIDKTGSSEISLPYVAADARGPKHFTLKVTREQVALLPQRMV